MNYSWILNYCIFKDVPVPLGTDAMSLSANNGGNCEMDVGGCKTNNSVLSFVVHSNERRGRQAV